MNDKELNSFRGIYYHNIDSSGRIVIPAKFRKVLRTGGGNGLIVSRLDKCLVAYSFKSWKKLENDIIPIAYKSEDMRLFRKKFISGAYDFFWDKKGLILIPPSIREYAELKKEIVFVGLLNRFEIMALDLWIKISDEIKIAVSSGQCEVLRPKQKKNNNIPDIIA